MSKHTTRVFHKLISHKHARPMRWQVDYDYIKILLAGAKGNNEKYAKECKEALEFLDKFSEEYYTGYFNRDKESLHPKELEKECYSRVNSNKRDMSSYWYKSDTDVYNDGGMKDD